MLNPDNNDESQCVMTMAFFFNINLRDTGLFLNATYLPGTPPVRRRQRHTDVVGDIVVLSFPGEPGVLNVAVFPQPCRKPDDTELRLFLGHLTDK